MKKPRAKPKREPVERPKSHTLGGYIRAYPDELRHSARPPGVDAMEAAAKPRNSLA